MHPPDRQPRGSLHSSQQAALRGDLLSVADVWAAGNVANPRAQVITAGTSSATRMRASGPSPARAAPKIARLAGSGMACEKALVTADVVDVPDSPVTKSIWSFKTANESIGANQRKLNPSGKQFYDTVSIL